MEKPPREDWYRIKRENPSFSSSLLDQIYRSIDESNGVRSKPDDEEILAMKKKKKKQQRDFLEVDDRSNVVLVHRRSIAADFESSRARRGVHSVFFKHSSSSSSDSSGFSSSESDSFYGRSRSSHSPPESRDYGVHKPIRTKVAESFEKSPQIHRSGAQNPNKRELGSFLRTKSKALKIYSDLKKVKQPISPGGRLSRFLSSILNSKKVKKTKNTNGIPEDQGPTSTCSSASSFSRSCLSKTPSSTGKSSSTGPKRSVRFCPVSVIVDEDLKPCGHKNLCGNEAVPRTKHDLYEELEFRVMEENRRVIEAAKDLLRNYNAKKDEINIEHENDEHDYDEDDDFDDAASYASSDLFELDNISPIGIERYREELPVYETTHLSTNRAIAKGLIV